MFRRALKTQKKKLDSQLFLKTQCVRKKRTVPFEKKKNQERNTTTSIDIGVHYYFGSWVPFACSKYYNHMAGLPVIPLQFTCTLHEITNKNRPYITWHRTHRAYTIKAKVVASFNAQVVFLLFCFVVCIQISFFFMLTILSLLKNTQYYNIANSKWLLPISWEYVLTRFSLLMDFFFVQT